MLEAQIEVGAQETQGLYDFLPKMVIVINGRSFSVLVVEDGRQFAFGPPYVEWRRGVIQQDVINPSVIKAGVKFRIVPISVAGFESVPVFRQTPDRRTR